jgi:eukaryotic-like serine/threonine-protein kinase
MAEQQPTVTAAPAPRLNDRYRLFERMAVGGMAEVWHAFDEALQRQVAVKIMKPALHANPVAVERFRREAMAGARLSHPGIVAVYDTISRPGLEAIVMELVNGCSLRQQLDRTARLDPSQVLIIATQVLSALSVAHRAGVVHRDIKPANIMLSDDGRVLLGDFGIAKAPEHENIDLTHDNVMIGTAKYLAPEQVTGDDVDARTDLYSFGVVLYECLSGEPLFDAGNDAATALARLHQTIAPIARVRRDVPIDLAELVDRLVRRDPGARPASAAEALEILGPVTSSRDRTPAAGMRAVHNADPTTALSGLSPRTPAAPTGHPTTAAPDTRRARNQAPSRRGRGPDNHHRPVGLVVAGLLVASVVTSAFIAGTSASGLGWMRDLVGGPKGSTAVGAPKRSVPMASVHSFDPNGDGTEHDDTVAAVADNDPTTRWTTEVYRGRDMAGKGGVGLVLELSEAIDAPTIEVMTTGADWGASVFASAAQTPPKTLAGWGAPMAAGRSSTSTLTLHPGGSGRWWLLWLTDPGVNDPRFSLSVTEISIHE